MKNGKLPYRWQQCLGAAATGIAFAILALPAGAQIVLGPTPPIETADGAGWFSGQNGAAMSSVTDTSFPFDSDTYDGMLSNSIAGSANNADFRSAVFSLGPAANGAQTVDFSFYYYAPSVNSGDNVRVDLRLWSGQNDTGFIDDNNQHPFSAGTMSGYSLWNSGPITTTGAYYADIRVSINLFGDDTWSSGVAYFDNFSVTTVPEPGPMALAGLGGLSMLALAFRRRQAVR